MEEPRVPVYIAEGTLLPWMLLLLPGRCSPGLSPSFRVGLGAERLQIRK